MTKACEWCGTTFKRLATTGRQKYCSRRCYLDSKGERSVQRICVQCKKQFRVVLSCAEQKHCSRECYMASRGAGSVTRPCPVCGRCFTTPLSVGAQHCSSACSGRSRRSPIVTISCAACNIEFQVRLCDQQRGRKYCSPTCRVKGGLKPPDQLADVQWRRKRLRDEGRLGPDDWNRSTAKPGHQICTKCLEEKPSGEFYFRAKKNRTESRCRRCMRAEQVAYRAGNGDVRVHKVVHSKRYRRLPFAGVLCTLTVDEWKEVLDAYGRRCAYCGRLPVRITLDHVVPVSWGGSHTHANVVPACQRCNSRKGDKLGIIPLAPSDFVDGVPVRKVDFSDARLKPARGLHPEHTAISGPFDGWGVNV